MWANTIFRYKSCTLYLSIFTTFKMDVIKIYLAISLLFCQNPTHVSTRHRHSHCQPADVTVNQQRENLTHWELAITKLRESISILRSVYTLLSHDAWGCPGWLDHHIGQCQTRLMTLSVPELEGHTVRRITQASKKMWSECEETH